MAAADPSYDTKVHLNQGGDTLVVESGGSIQLLTGAKLVPNSGTLPAAITAPANTGSSNSTPYGYTTAAQADAVVTAVIAIIAALQAAGITS